MLTVKELKEFIKDLSDDIEVTVESVIVDGEGWLSAVDDISTIENPMRKRLLVLKPVDVAVE
ncbi:hypothetical protein [Desulforamulus reducens]|uniref:hypothetical protein n=1 Tax=Desulforamulus reducens TaxID=59610 RepID=UPI0003135971|nr:hypothetical protein [Desulforamulus reducens]